MHLQPIETPKPKVPTISITETLQAASPPPPPAPTPRPLYFAYGSNLSPTQMRLRCTTNPTSARPVGIARLENWRWMICESGYANVLPPVALRVGRQASHGGIPPSPSEGDADAVFGVLYELDPADEFLLDWYEGVDHAAAPSRLGACVPLCVRPTEQGRGSYNKWYLSATVVRWLDGVRGVGAGAGDGEQVVPVLVYVDENRVRMGPPMAEYILRMNLAIREAELIGFPKQWADEAMRKAIHLHLPVEGDGELE